MATTQGSRGNQYHSLSSFWGSASSWQSPGCIIKPNRRSAQACQRVTLCNIYFFNILEFAPEEKCFDKEHLLLAACWAQGCDVTDW